MVEPIRRDDFVRLGRDVSLSLGGLAPEARSLIETDAVLSTLVDDEVIRGSDFGRFYDRLSELDRLEGKQGNGSLGRAEQMYVLAGGAPQFKNDFAINKRTTMGIFASPMNAKSAKAKEPTIPLPPDLPNVFRGANADINTIKADPKASITLPKADAAKPADAAARIAKGEAALKRAEAETKQGQFGAAAESQREAAQAFADAGELPRASAAAALSAESFQKAGQTAEAASMFVAAGKAADATQDFEKSGGLYVKAGRAFQKLKRNDDAQTAFICAGDRYRDEAIYQQSGLGRDEAVAARNWDLSTRAYLEGGAKLLAGEDGKDRLRFGGNRIADLAYTTERIKAGASGAFAGRGAGERAAAEHYEAIGDRLAANGEREQAAKYYQKAKAERGASGIKDATADDRLAMKIAGAGAALNETKVENYTKTLRQQTAAGEWEKVEGTLKELHQDLKTNPNSFPRKETEELAQQLGETGKAAAKESEWSVWEILAAIFACLTVVGLAFFLPAALISTDNDRVRDLAPELKEEAEALLPIDAASADANVALQEAHKHEQTELDLPQGITLAPDGEYYSLGEDTPAMKAAAAYARAHGAENVDPELRDTIDRRAGAVLGAEMERVEESTDLSALQKAVYFQRAAEFLPPAAKARALDRAAQHYAKMAAGAEAADPAIAGSKRAVSIADAIGVSRELRVELEKAEKNLGKLAAKATGTEKANLLHAQARVNAKLAATTDDAAKKKELYTKAAKLAEDAVASSPAISSIRAEALQSAGNYRALLGETAAAKDLHARSARAFEALAEGAINDTKMSATDKFAAASDAYANAAEEYRKIGKDKEAANADNKAFEYSNRATFAQLTALAPPAFKGDPTKKITGEQIAKFDEAKLGRPSRTTEDYVAGAKAFGEMANMATDEGAQRYYQAASKRYAALAEMSSRLPSGAAALTHPPSQRNMEDYAKASKAQYIERYKATHDGEAPSDAAVASHVAARLSGVYNAFYVHQNDRGGPIDRKNGAKDVGAGPDGRVMIDCVTCTLDLNTAMSAAGFKLQSVGATRDKQFGAGHLMLEVQSQDGTPLGFFNNLTYKSYSSQIAAEGELDAAFREVIGNDPPFIKTRNDPDKDPAGTTGAP